LDRRDFETRWGSAEGDLVEPAIDGKLYLDFVMLSRVYAPLELDVANRVRPVSTVEEKVGITDDVNEFTDEL